MEDKSTVVVKVIPKNKDHPNEYAYSKEIDNLSSVHRGSTGR
jgi:hypothetical protein